MKIDVNEHIRKRPGMYLGGNGSKGIIKLLQGLILDVNKKLQNKRSFFHFSILEDNLFRLEVRAKGEAIDLFSNTSPLGEGGIPYYSVLQAVSDRVEVDAPDNSSISVTWSFDDQVIRVTDVDYVTLVKEIEVVAFLHRDAQFLITDNRKEYLNQNFFAHPEGVKYLYERYKLEVLGTPQFEILFDDEIDKYQLEIYLGYRTDWYPNPTVVSFANEIETVCAGSLVDGILEGLLLGCEEYFKQSKLPSYKAEKEKLQNGLILVCAVKGGTFKYGGSFKESLIDDEVKELSMNLTKKLTLDFIEGNLEKAMKFLWRFDENHLTSGIM